MSEPDDVVVKTEVAMSPKADLIGDVPIEEGAAGEWAARWGKVGVLSHAMR